MLGLRTWTPATTPPSTLRHTFGKSALDAGVDLVTVSRLIGHERLETTAIYTVPSAAGLEKAVERLEADYIKWKWSE
jgi:site-specific recombinase XerD